jgi:thioredoxin-like negative regulator of GroEL
MHTIALGLLIAAAAPVVATPAEPAAPPPLSEVLKEASAQHRPVLIDVYTSWCGPCARLAKEVFPRPDVQRALTGWRFVSYDAEKGVGIDVAERFDIHSYPTLLVLDPAGEVVTRIQTQDAAGIISALERFREVASSSDPLEERAKSSRDPNLLWLAAARTKDPQRATTLLRKVLAADPKNVHGVGAKAGLALAREEAAHRDARSHAALLLRLATEWPSSEEGVEALGAIAAFDPADRPQIGTIRAALRRSARLLQAAKEADALNRLVYAALELRELPTALVAAKALVALVPAGADERDSLAEVYFRSGDRARALETEKAALALPNASPLLKMNLARFEKEAPPAEAVVPHRDPLAPCAAEKEPAPWEKFQRQLQFFQVRLTDRLHAACAGLPALEYVRLYLADGKVKRAVLLDPEADAQTRACAEKAAMAADHFPDQWKGKQTVTAMTYLNVTHGM